VLVRTEPGRNNREGKAFLGTARQNPQTYAAGALLANGARIEEIYADHVVLERNGKRAKLYVESKQQSKAPSELLTVGGQAKPAPAAAMHREVLTDYIRPSPVYEDDRIKGYQVYAGKQSGIFNQLGLQNGDVILTLNDLPFVDPKQANELFQQLASGIAMVATVERQGKVQRLSLDGGLIAADQERAKQPLPPLPAMPGAPP
jgi:general secretion pathway protein C